MIYTITFNPAVEVVVTLEQFKLNGVNHATNQQVHYGTGGIDVSRVLGSLGRPSKAWGFLAGLIGHALEEALTSEGLDTEFVMLPQGDTCINTRLVAPSIDGLRDNPAETLLAELGPEVDKSSQLLLFRMLQTTSNGDMLVVSGDVPGGVSPHVYARIIESQKNKQVSVVIDAQGDLLLNSLQHKPFLVKTSSTSLAEIVEASPRDHDALVKGAFLLRELGASNVLVSLDGNADSGAALLLDEEGGLHEAEETCIDAINTIGVSEAMLAGFVHGYLLGREEGQEPAVVYALAFEIAVACARAMACSQGQITRGEVDHFLS